MRAGYAQSVLVRSLGLILAAIALAGTARADTLAYDESVSGDLPENSPWVLLNLGVGVNTVTGTGHFAADATQVTSIDFDSFRFTVPDGAELTSIRFDATVTNSTNPTSLTIDTFLDQGPFPTYTTLSEEFVGIYPSSTTNGDTLSSALPVGPGDYLLYQGQMEGWSNESLDWNYTYTLTVESTPLPAPALAAAVLLVVAFAARKFSRAARLA